MSTLVLKKHSRAQGKMEEIRSGEQDSHLRMSNKFPLVQRACSDTIIGGTEQFYRLVLPGHGLINVHIRKTYRSIQTTFEPFYRPESCLLHLSMYERRQTQNMLGKLSSKSDTSILGPSTLAGVCLPSTSKGKNKYKIHQESCH